MRNSVKYVKESGTYMLRFLRYLPAWVLWLLPALSFAMEFRLHFEPEQKINIVIGEGEITDGDDKKFLDISKLANRDAEGHVIFVLNSLGGSVKAAFELASAMDEVGVYTLVPDNAFCASACASIVYISGTRRNIVGTGRLGFHSCYTEIDGVTVEDSVCNHLIAKNAFERGLSYASVDLFVHDYGADKIAWVGRDVACAMLPGICRPTLKERTRASYSPSFDCDKAHTNVENMICSDKELSFLDKEMAELYRTGLAKQSSSRDFRHEQRTWLREFRNRCNDKACLITAYKKRISVLVRYLPTDSN